MYMCILQVYVHVVQVLKVCTCTFEKKIQQVFNLKLEGGNVAHGMNVDPLTPTLPVSGSNKLSCDKKKHDIQLS